MPLTAAYRCDFHFVQDGARWKETHYSLDAGSVRDAATKAFALAKLRNDCLGVGATLTKVVASNDLVYKDSWTISMFNEESKLIKGVCQVATLAAAPAYMAWLARAEGNVVLTPDAGTYRASIFLSGVPKVSITTDGDWNRPDPIGNAWKQYQVALQSGKWGFKAISKEAGATAWADIKSVTFGVGNCVINTSANTFAVGQTIQVRGMRVQGGTRLQGRYTVAAGGAQTFTVNVVGTQPVAFLSLGAAHVVDQVLVPYRDIIPRQCTRRLRAGAVEGGKGRRKRR